VHTAPAFIGWAGRDDLVVGAVTHVVGHV
jgi:hypothetical protein